MKKTFTSISETETKTIARDLAKLLKVGDVVALNGELGAGKTVFVQAIAKYLGIDKNVSSPTYTIIKEYQCTVGSKKCLFQHIDLYRIGTNDELIKQTLSELLHTKNTLICIEWTKNITMDLLKNIYTVSIEILDIEKRNITIEYP